jgi:hypothetical protein
MTGFEDSSVDGLIVEDGGDGGDGLAELILN